MGNSASVPLRVRRRRTRESSAIDLLYTKPSGLYPHCDWEVKTVRRLILRGELAPRYPGRDEATATAREECPICMLNYPVLNQTCCCSARLCTECYLQIRPPRHNKEPCPFCKYKPVEAVYMGPREKAEIDREEADERRALEAMKRANLESTTEEDRREGCGCHMADRATRCGEDHRARYYHADKAPMIDPLLLEAMASEVTFSSAASSAGASHSGAERASASSSGVLESHGLLSESEAEGSVKGGAGMASSSSRVFESDEEFEADEAGLKEAIRRSVMEF